MKLSDRDIAIRLLALDEGETTMEETQSFLDHWAKHFGDMASYEHEGDCVKAVRRGAYTCVRCSYDETMHRVAIARELFGIEAP